MENAVNRQTMQLVAGAKSGNQSAIEQLYRTYSERILQIVRHRMGSELRSRMESMDIVQDTLFSVLKDLDDFTYKNEGDFMRWVSTITENRIRDNIDKLHAMKRDIGRETPRDSSRQSTDDSGRALFEPRDSATPSMNMSRSEECDRLHQAIESLKPEYREVIMLTRMDGLSYKETAEKLGKSPEAIRMLLSRALTSLSALLEETNETTS